MNYPIIIMSILSGVLLFILVIILIIKNSREHFQSSFSIIPDNYTNGIVQPRFVAGNPFDNIYIGKYSWNKYSQSPQVKPTVFGIGDKTGEGWIGGDSVGSFSLPNGDVIVVYGDSFLGKINQPSIWIAQRETQFEMPHNSISYWQKSTDIQYFFVGNHQKFLSNQGNICKHESSTIDMKRYEKDPLLFESPGCSSLIQTNDVEKYAWLYGGIVHQDGHIALLSSVIQDGQIVTSQWVEIKNAFDSSGLRLNPFLWDINSTKINFGKGIQQKDSEFAQITYEKVFKDVDGQYVLMGCKNKKPIGSEIYLVKGTYDQLVNQRDYMIWDGKWKKMSTPEKMKPLVIHQDKLYAGAGISEIYFSKIEKTYAFYSLSSNDLHQYIILRYKSISKKLQGPYSLDKSFEFTLPMWINQNPDAYQVYALRIHPDLIDKVSDPENTECVLSYIGNPSVPVYMGNVCNTESAYLNYYPQFVLIKK